MRHAAHASLNAPLGYPNTLRDGFESHVGSATRPSVKGYGHDGGMAPGISLCHARSNPRNAWDGGLTFYGRNRLTGQVPVVGDVGSSPTCDPTFEGELNDQRPMSRPHYRNTLERRVGARGRNSNSCRADSQNSTFKAENRIVHGSTRSARRLSGYPRGPHRGGCKSRLLPYFKRARSIPEAGEMAGKPREMLAWHRGAQAPTHRRGGHAGIYHGRVSGVDGKALPSFVCGNITFAYVKHVKVVFAVVDKLSVRTARRHRRTYGGPQPTQAYFSGSQEGTRHSTRSESVCSTVRHTRWNGPPPICVAQATRPSLRSRVTMNGEPALPKRAAHMVPKAPRYERGAMA